MFTRTAPRYLRLAALVIAAAALLTTSRDGRGLQAQTSSPVAAFAFSEGGGTTAADGSGNSNTATLLNGTVWASGVYGSGLQLDGINDAVQIASSGSLDLAGGFTFETWIKPTAASTAYLWSRQQDSGQGAYALELEPNGAVSIGIYTSTTNYPMTTVPRVRLNEWTHVAVTYDGLSLKIYFDAIEVARRTVAGTLVASSQPMRLGEWLTGFMDETRIYRRALSASEIARDRGTPVDDAAPFQVTMSTPAINALGVLTTPVTAMFSRDVNGLTVSPATFELRDGANALVNATVSYSAATRTATLTPVSSLAPSADYTARVVGGSSGVTDAASRTLSADVTWTFRTAAAAGTPSVALAFGEGTGTTTVDWSGNGNPALLVNNPTWTAGRFGNGVRVAGGADEVQVPASETLALTNAFTFEAWINPSQYTTGELWKQFLADGSRMYGLEITGSGAVKFSPHLNNVDYPLMTISTLPLNTWTHLAVTYDGSSIRIYFNGIEVANRLASGSLAASTQPMEIGQWTVGKLDEVRIYRTALDATAISADVSAPTDPTPPFQVTGNTPIGGSLGVLTTPVTATFSGVVDTSTVTASTFVLRDSSDTPVSTSLTYDAPSRTATLTPTDAIAPLSDYTATVVGGPNGVKDAMGAALTGNVSWTFRTAAGTSAPAAAYAFSEGAGTTTAEASDNVGAAVLTSGVTWTSGQFGNGVQFAGGYAEVRVPASESLALSNAFTFEAWICPTTYVWAELWRQVLPSSAQMYAFQMTNTGAVSFAVALSGTDYPLASMSKVPLNAWSHVAVTYDGRYIRLYINGAEVASRTATGSLPSSSQPMEIGQWFQGKVDEVRLYRRALSAGEIALDRGTAIDAAAPLTVSSTTPSNAALGVLASSITATFSYAVNPETINTGTFELRDRANAVVVASVSYNAGTRTATLTPSSALVPLGDYTARIAAGSQGVIDVNARTLAADVTWSFRTAQPSSSPSAEYSFAEGVGTSAADSSGNGHTAQLVQRPAWTTGRFGSGLQFAGGYDEVQAPSSKTLGLSSAFTFEAWVRPTARAGGDLWRQVHADGHQSYGISTTGAGAVDVSPHLGDSDYPLVTSATLPLNAWTHLAVTYDGAYLRVYFDGVEVANRAASGLLAETTPPIEMGQWFQGILDEVRIYRIALSAAAIAADRDRPVFCSYATSTRSVTASSNGSSGSFDVTASPGCGWTPVSSASWVTASPSGNSVTYVVEPNDLPTSRTSDLTVADQVVVITQEAAQAPSGSSSSPDSQVVAVWYQEPARGRDRARANCVQLRWENQRGAANGNCSFVGTSDDNPSIKWTGRRQLTIAYAPGTKVSKADTKWNDVTILYAKDPKLQKK